MYHKTFLVLFALLFGTSVLLISVFRAASVKYDFADNTVQVPVNVLGNEFDQINYYLPYPGKVLPDSPIWFLKALRDRAWLAVTTNPSREAELNLLFADKRLGSAKILFENRKPEIGLSTLSKAEKYLEEASNKEKENRKKGIDTSEFLKKIASASLKHYELIQYILGISPEEARPIIIKSQDYARGTYEDSRNALLEKKIDPPENPFDW